MGNWLKGRSPHKARGNGGCETRKGRLREIFDHSCCEFTYPDGSICSVSATSIWVAGMKWPNRHRLQRQERLRAQRYQRPEFVAPSRRQKDPYQQEHDDLFAAIRNDTPLHEAGVCAHSTLPRSWAPCPTYSGKKSRGEQALNSSSTPCESARVGRRDAHEART